MRTPRSLAILAAALLLTACARPAPVADAPTPTPAVTPPPAPAPAPPLPPPPPPPPSLPPPRDAFRAVGQEPGWFVDVAHPAMHVEADYGEIVFDAVDVVGDDTGWTARTPGGEPVTLRITLVPCADGMSGREYEATATLAIGERRYSGCGEFTR